MRRRRLAALALMLVMCASLAAQQTTGAIVGAVADGSGAVLPGVTITLSGEHIMGGAQSTQSGSDGSYRFASISAGSYELSFVLPGFATVRRTGVRVLVGSTVEENARLAVASLTEEVTVEGSRALIDTETNKSATTYDKAWIDNAPLKRQSFFDIISSAPGIDPQSAANGKAPTSFGGLLDQNQYSLDGIDLTDNFNGGATTMVQPNVDLLEEVQILSLGAPAEYGNVQGAVFNVVTRSGTNAFHGSNAYYHQSQRLTGRNTSAAVDRGLPFTRLRYRDYTAQLGGPIVKDRVWFFGAYQYLSDANVIAQAPEFASSLRLHNYFFKPNIRLASGHTLQGTLNYGRRAVVQPLLTGDDPITQEGNRRNIPTVGASYTGTLGNQTVLEASYAGFYVAHHKGDVDGNRQIGTRFRDLRANVISGAIQSWYEYHVDRTAVNGKLTHYASEFLGASHTFKFGVQLNHAPSVGTYGVNDTVDMPANAGSRFGYGYEYSPYRYGGAVMTSSAYVDDAVRVGDRLTLNLGLRYDQTHTRSYAQPKLDELGNPTAVEIPGLDYYTWRTISPRLGVNLKLRADGQTVLKGHYGRYYAGGSTGAFASSVPSVAPSYSGTYNFATGRFEDLLLNTDNSNLYFDPDQQAPFTDQFIVGVEQGLWNSLNIGATYVRKQSRRYPAWTDTGGVYLPITYMDTLGAEASGEPITVYQLQNSSDERFFVFTTQPDSRSDVDALSLTATKRMSNNWQLTSSLVLSKTTGQNIQGSSASLNFRDFGRNPNELVNWSGLLPGDRRYMFKTQFLYTGLPGGFTVGVNYALSDGYPVIRQVRVPATRLTSTITTHPRNNEQRFPDINMLDLRAQKSLRLRGDLRVNVFADVFNVLNSGAYQSYLSNLATSTNYHLQSNSGTVQPRRLMLGVKVEF